ncbi:MAG: 16S rRNA (guanine(527)-N(7))-methyltransferase RsmG [Firmicutes bacterium]|nr:16S rRNA (guanine(527)-N(7))-methyltransferase RsmG [Bacillota bacterium]
MDKAIQLIKLRDVILEWNEKINVTAIRDPEEFDKKNVQDSLSICGLPEYEAARTVLDLGTGGGFPGLPLAIVSPEKSFVLADAIGKKLKVVQAAAQALSLVNVETVHGRAEDMAKTKVHRERYDLVVSRAVANMATLSEYCLPFVRTGGFFVAYKTEDAAEEIEAAKGAIAKLGGRILRIEKPSSNNDEPYNGHVLVVVEKIAKTPKEYPRKAGMPGKDPLK